MNLQFQSRTLPEKPVDKTKNNIIEVIREYRRVKLPMKQLLNDFYFAASAAKNSKTIFRPWPYYYKKATGLNIEGGVSGAELFFEETTTKLKNELPTDVINACFYAGKERNDYSIEIGYLLPEFSNLLKSSDTILVVNPSPDIVLQFESVRAPEKCIFALPDKTVSGLYSLQYPESRFVSFDEMSSLNKSIDAALIINRDQKLGNASILLGSLNCCKDTAFAVALAPSLWYEKRDIGANKILREANMSIQQMLIVDSSVSKTIPRKKTIVLFRHENVSDFEVRSSQYDKDSRMLNVLDHIVSVNAKDYLSNSNSILSIWRSQLNPKPSHEAKYSKAIRKAFSNEISIFYTIYKVSENSYRGNAYYREILCTDPISWGQKVGVCTEKGLRAKTEDEISSAIDNLAFSDMLYGIIHADIYDKYILKKIPFSLKTYWHYCYSEIKDLKQYNHNLICKMMAYGQIACYSLQKNSDSDFLEILSEATNINVDDIPYTVFIQFNILFSHAKKDGIINNNPLENYVSKRATIRQQDVRNALVKKHFLQDEEMLIFSTLANMKIDGTDNSNLIIESLPLATLIRMFSGMAIREVAALTWEDLIHIDCPDIFQFSVTKFVDKDGQIIKHAEKENWIRFRLVPVAKALQVLLVNRKRYLLSLGISEQYLNTCPIIIDDSRLDLIIAQEELSHVKPKAISSFERKIISRLKIPENSLILPGESNDLVSDFNTYHGDIFLSNFRHKANHKAKLTMGEINYMIGIAPPDTFSKYYCDYSSDLIQDAIIQKLNRWDIIYERKIAHVSLREPQYYEIHGEYSGNVGPFSKGLSRADLIIKNDTKSETIISAKCEHGIDYTITMY